MYTRPKCSGLGFFGPVVICGLVTWCVLGGSNIPPLFTTTLCAPTKSTAAHSKFKPTWYDPEDHHVPKLHPHVRWQVQYLAANYPAREGGTFEWAHPIVIEGKRNRSAPFFAREVETAIGDGQAVMDHEFLEQLSVIEVFVP